MSCHDRKHTIDFENEDIGTENTNLLSLMEKAKAVMDSNDVKYIFTQNREVFDYDGFKIFTYRNKKYILKMKRSEAIPLEFINAEKANKMLIEAGVKEFHVPVPKLVFSNDAIGLLTPYYGRSLYENCSKTAQRFSQEYVARGFKKLLDLGIEWEGWLPRNMLPDGDRLILIDWEKTVFHNQSVSEINSMTLFKLILGWSQVYGDIKTTEECFKTVLNGIGIHHSDLDEFERVLGELFELKNDATIRLKGIEITLDSEGPSSHTLTHYLSFMDIGHMIDEYFSIHISVWYTCFTAVLRKKGRYLLLDQFLHVFYHISDIARNKSNKSGVKSEDRKKTFEIQLLLMIYLFHQPKEAVLESLSKAETIKDMVSLLVRTDTAAAYLCKYLRLKNRKGLDAAVKRSDTIQIFLDLFFYEIKKVFPVCDHLDLLLRGSCSQRLMTKRSDVDFELSGPAYPKGCIEAEKIISEILDVFDIKNEGSQGRPIQKDFVGDNGFVRDYHEWIELTKPNRPYRDRGWLEDVFHIPENIWKNYSEYERTPCDITAKLLFFRCRALISRLAVKYRLTETSITRQLQILQAYLPEDYHESLEELLKAVLELYEESDVINEKSVASILQINRSLDLSNEKLELIYYRI